MSAKGTIVAISLTALLVIAPLISFYYLRSGLEYRLESIDQLKPKEINNDLYQSLTDLRSGDKATLYHIGMNKQSNDLIVAIADKVIERESFEVFSVMEDSSLLAQHEIIPITSSLANDEIDFVLMDIGGKVRGAYSTGEDHSKSIIRHLSVVIPMPKQRSIELRRDVERVKNIEE